jgi:carbohydrate-binding DOMON domain-containing protein
MNHDRVPAASSAGKLPPVRKVTVYLNATTRTTTTTNITTTITTTTTITITITITTTITTTITITMIAYIHQHVAADIMHHDCTLPHSLSCSETLSVGTWMMMLMLILIMMKAG